jgi:hypothetical protein
MMTPSARVWCCYEATTLLTVTSELNALRRWPATRTPSTPTSCADDERESAGGVADSTTAELREASTLKSAIVSFLLASAGGHCQATT